MQGAVVHGTGMVWQQRCEAQYVPVRKQRDLLAFGPLSSFHSFYYTSMLGSAAHIKGVSYLFGSASLKIIPVDTHPEMCYHDNPKSNQIHNID